MMVLLLLAETNFKCRSDHTNVRIQYSGRRAKTRGISETMVCSLMFTWSSGPLSL